MSEPTPEPTPTPDPPTPPAPPTPAPTPPPADRTDGKTAEALNGILDAVKGIPDSVASLINAQGPPAEPAPPATPGQEPPTPAPAPTPEPEPKPEAKRYAGAGGKLHGWWYGEPK